MLTVECYKIMCFCHYAVHSALLAEMELRVGNKYRLGRKIGSGSFGDIYLGLSLFLINLKQDWQTVSIACDWFSFFAQ